MADHDHAAAPAGEVFLEALDGRQVEVIGRLVEQEHVGLADQDAGEVDPPHRAGGEIRDAPGRIDLEAVEHGRRTVRRQLALVGDLPAQRRLERAEPRIQLRFLGQIGDGAAGALQPLAAVQLDQPCQRLEQGRLAGAVAADQTDAISIADRDAERAEQRLGAEPDGGIAERDEERRHVGPGIGCRARLAPAPGVLSARIARGNGGPRSARPQMERGRGRIRWWTAPGSRPGD